MKITYESGWENLNIHVDLAIPYEENYQMKMISNNSFKYLIKAKGSGRDGETRYTFKIDGDMVSMQKMFCAREMTGTDIENFIQQLISAADEITAHFLNPDGILLVPKTIFFKEGKYYFCYIPAGKQLKRNILCNAFHAMTEYFVKNLDYHDTEGIFLVYRIHKETMAENYDLKKIMETYEKEKRERTQQKENKKKKETDKNYDKTEDDIEPGVISERAVFDFDDEESSDVYHNRNQDLYKSEEKQERNHLLKRAVQRFKSGRWGEWDDLITEMDGQNHRRKL